MSEKTTAAVAGNDRKGCAARVRGGVCEFAEAVAWCALIAGAVAVWCAVTPDQPSGECDRAAAAFAAFAEGGAE